MAYIHSDHLNTPKVVTELNQQVVWKGDYTPFGEVDAAVENVEMNLRFPGQYEDAETGLNYNYFRSYNPATGRYTQSDPIGQSAGPNLYSYVAQNPIVAFDARGLDKVVERTFRVESCALHGPLKTISNYARVC